MQELKRSSTRRSCLSIETTTEEQVELNVEEEEEIIETDMIEYGGQRRCGFNNSNSILNFFQVYFVIWIFQRRQYK